MLDFNPPMEEQGKAHKMTVLSFRRIDRGYLKGFLDIRMNMTSMVIKDISLFEKNGGRWISLPSRPYTGKSGKTQYQSIVEFENREMANRFRDSVLSALERYRPSAPKPRQPDQGPRPTTARTTQSDTGYGPNPGQMPEPTYVMGGGNFRPKDDPYKYPGDVNDDVPF